VRDADGTIANDTLTEAVIGRAIEVHRRLGPGLLESTYGECLAWELRDEGLKFARQVQVPVVYRGEALAAVYRLDFVVEDRVVLEIKAVERLAPVHEAQLLTYLKHTGIPVGLLLNFNCAVLKDGLRRLEISERERTTQ
jgi:GxxExxY protein